MLFSVAELQNIANINPVRIVHVGAHLAEERTAYFAAWGSKLEKIIWIEAQHEFVDRLKNLVNEKIEEVIEAVVWFEEKCEVDFFRASNSEASSLMKFDQHAIQYPDISIEEIRQVNTTTLESILRSENCIDFLNLDIQGAELAALQGLGEKIRSIRWIYCEVNKIPLYDNVPLLSELKDFLKEKGFRLLSTRWTPSAGWGDAIFVQKKEFRFMAYLKLLVLNQRFYIIQAFHRVRAITHLRTRFNPKNFKH